MTFQECIQKPNTVYLNTARKDAKNSRSLLFSEPITIIKAEHYSDVQRALYEIDEASQKHWLAGFISYEAAFVLEETFAPFCKTRAAQAVPLVWFGVYSRPKTYESEQMPRAPQWPIQAYQSPIRKFSLTYDDYAIALKKIKKYIQKGDTYQVNYTFDVLVQLGLTPVEIYSLLLQNQKTPYCAYVQTPMWDVLSFSPELFFRREGDTIAVKPMKGTAERGASRDTDKAIKTALSLDDKNRAENIMIVDLLRNDLGRIARPGTVCTKKLFEIETHPTLHQMTSTVTATLRKNVKYSDIFANVFPSGSVTGAPKVHTMEIIKEVERGSRGVYCGAIGYISPKGKAVFSVPIRTLQKQKKENAWRYRVGSGIIWDSRPKAEWEECRIKTDFLTPFSEKEFEIVTTMLWKKRLVYKKDHVARLKKSAHYFLFPFKQERLSEIVQKIERTLDQEKKYRVRITLNRRGHFSWSYVPILFEGGKPSFCIAISPLAVEENTPFLYHKTTQRSWYDAARSDIDAHALYDMVFYNKKGYVTEGTRTNVFIEKRGNLYTPPVSCGLLPGVLRERLLQQCRCVERKLTLSDLKRADRIYCGNSVRGLQQVSIKKL